MEREGKKVDGFRFLPPSLRAWVKTFIPDEEFKGHIPWTPMSKLLSHTTVALVTSAGISLKSDPPFDMERERREPLWGDRSYRMIPKGMTESKIPQIRYQMIDLIGKVEKLSPLLFNLGLSISFDAKFKWVRL